MGIRRDRTRRSSEADVALVRMQIAAQARNQRWHDFLCNKRDELQVRLRQQGTSVNSVNSANQIDGHSAGRYAPGPTVAPLSQADATASPGAWRSPGLEAESAEEPASAPEGLIEEYEQALLLGEDCEDGEEGEWGEWGDDPDLGTARLSATSGASDPQIHATPGARNPN